MLRTVSVLRTTLCFLLGVSFSFSSYAEFWDQSDYIENKEMYDEVSHVIETLYHPTMKSGLKEASLQTQDKKLVSLLKALKSENEKALWQILKDKNSISNEEIEKLMSERSTIQALKLTLENDFLAGTDRFYTNGVKIDLSFNNKSFEAFFKKLGYSHTDFFFLCEQEIYNQSDRKKQNEGVIVGEAGIAGVLYCSTAANAYKTNEDKTRFKSLERFKVSMGSIGQSSLGEEVQNGFHDLITDKRVNWDYQIADRFYFQVDFQTFRKVAEGNLYGDSRPEYAVMINGGGQAGTYTNYANLGMIFNYRLLGSLIDMYVAGQTPPSKLEKLAALNPAARVKVLVCERDWSANMYFGAGAKYVLNNNRIDNTGFDVRSKDFVVDLKAGSVVRYKELYLEAGYVKTSSKWESTLNGQQQPSHTYGHLSATVPFGSLGDLGSKLYSPIKWVTSKKYRQELKDEMKLKKQMREQGLSIVLDKDDPNKTIDIVCD
jgi:hypothetical protein